MANKSIFGSAPRGRTPAPADAVNSAGGKAYSTSAEEALAQYAATGTFADTFYNTAEKQLERTLELMRQCSPEYIGALAVYARRSGKMKDMPAMLVAELATRGPGGLDMLRRVFHAVIDNGRMLRTFVQIIRSNQLGRKSFGTAPRRLIREWFDRRSDEEIFRASIGNAPSLADVVKMVHPRPLTDSRRALYAWLVGAPHSVANLPPIVEGFESFKKIGGITIPDVPWEMLTALPLTASHWQQIAERMSWTQLRMNLNTLDRHGVFAHHGTTLAVAKKLADPEQVRRSKCLPYQLLIAYKTATGVPAQVRNALQDAMEVATENAAAVRAGRVVVCPDVSGSMSSPITGNRVGASAVRCIDVAALISAVLLRANPEATVLPFEVHVRQADMNPRDSVMTNAQKLAAMGGGGTDCSAPLAHLNAQRAQVDLVVMVSDNESWYMNQTHGARTMKATSLATQWAALKARCPRAKMVCIDLEASDTVQAPTDRDVLNVGGFSDQVFETIVKFASGDRQVDGKKILRENVDAAMLTLG